MHDDHQHEPEKALITRLGASRDHMRKIRKERLTAGEHYKTIGQGGKIVYTPAGVDEVCRLLGIPATANPDKTKDILCVVLQHPDAPFYLRGQYEGETILIRIMEPGVNNKKFAIGSSIVVVKVGEEYEVYGKPAQRLRI